MRRKKWRSRRTRYLDVMAGKPETGDVPVLISSADVDAAIDQLPTKAYEKRRRHRRRQREQSLRRGDVRQRTTVSDIVTVVVGNAAEPSTRKNCASRSENSTRGDDVDVATAGPAATASCQNSTKGRIDIEVLSMLQCSVSLFAFGEWVLIVKDNRYMVYFADKFKRSLLVPNSILQRQVATTSVSQTTLLTDDEYVTCIEHVEVLSQGHGACDDSIVQEGESRRRDETCRLDRQEKEKRIEREQAALDARCSGK